MNYGAASVAVLAQEAMMAASKAIASKIGFAAVAGKIIDLKAAIVAEPFALAIKPAIAAGIVKALGEPIIDYFENDEGLALS